MFYRLIKFYARLAIKIYCPRIIVNKEEVLKYEGPLLLASNHPNSFLDGVILTTLFDHPVYSLARGDAFQIKWIDRLLRDLQLLPVYRTSEGVHNLEHNYTTFAACQKAFEKRGIVLIFSEGRCENEWHLRPLKKGTARLATTAWKNNIPLQVIPTALNYSSFKKFGKEIHLNFGDPITSRLLQGIETEGKQLLLFNEVLEEQLRRMIYEIPAGDEKQVRKRFPLNRGFLFYALILPALAGWIIHAPLFFFCRIVSERFRNTGHYDSVLNALLLLLYPFYFIACLIVVYQIHHVYGWLALLVPFTAWACAVVKYEATG